MAALDYIVCLLSEVFVTTHGGNFPHFLMGQRRFLYGGHAKTIIPDKHKLVVLLEDRNIRYSAPFYPCNVYIFYGRFQIIFPLTYFSAVYYILQ